MKAPPRNMCGAGRLDVPGDGQGLLSLSMAQGPAIMAKWPFPMRDISDPDHRVFRLNLPAHQFVGPGDRNGLLDSRHPAKKLPSTAPCC